MQPKINKISLKMLLSLVKPTVEDFDFSSQAERKLVGGVMMILSRFTTEKLFVFFLNKCTELNK